MLKTLWQAFTLLRRNEAAYVVVKKDRAGMYSIEEYATFNRALNPQKPGRSE